MLSLAAGKLKANLAPGPSDFMALGTGHKKCHFGREHRQSTVIYRWTLHVLKN